MKKKDKNRIGGETTNPGFVNKNKQVVIRNTRRRGTDYGQSVYQMACSVCGYVYGVNGSDTHLRKCPKHQKGANGLPF